MICVWESTPDHNKGVFRVTDSRVQHFFEEIRGKRVAFCGIGGSNLPLVRIFHQKGAEVIACDRRTRDQLGAPADELEGEGVELRLGPDYLDELDVDIIFRTPGMKFDMPELCEARSRGIAVTSEMEVFFDLCPAKFTPSQGATARPPQRPSFPKCCVRRGRRFTSAATSAARFCLKLKKSRPMTLPWWSFQAFNSSPCAVAPTSPS